MTSQSEAGRFPISVRGLSAGLFLLVLTAYLPSARFDFIYDDHEVILAQRAPESLGDVTRLFAERHFYNLPYYRPITRTTLLVQKSLHGANPAPFHLFNAALMAMNAMLAFALLTRPQFGLAGARGGTDDPAPDRLGGAPWAAFAAALFALHPVASSCVYPIASGRETAMPAFWMLLATLMWFRGGARNVAAAWAAFAGALLSKEQAVVLPGVFLAADLAGLTRPPGLSLAPTARALRAWLLRYLPGVILMFLYFLIRSALFGGSEFTSGGALGPLQSFAYSVQTLLIPTLGLVYEPEFPIWFSAARLGAALVLLAALLGTFIRFVPRARSLGAFWFAWFVLVQLPTANVIDQEARFDERYLFLGSLGLWFVIAAVARETSAFVISWRRGTSAAAVVMVLAVCGISLHRGTYFKSDHAFHSQWFATNPDSVNANVQLGRLLGERGEYAESMRHFQLALARYPDYPEAHGSLAVTLKRQGRIEEALAHGRRAVELKPDYAEAWFNQGAMLADAGRYPEAAACFERTLEIQPSHAEASYNLGNMRRRSGRTDEAVSLYRRAIAADPSFFEARFNLANALADAGDAGGAVRELQELLRGRPDFAEGWMNLGVLFATGGDMPRAAECFETALRLEPDNTAAAENLARARGAVSARRSPPQP